MSSTACCPDPCNNGNPLTWLLCPSIDHVSSALQILLDLAREDKGALVEKVLQHCNPELCIDVLRKLLKSSASWSVVLQSLAFDGLNHYVRQVKPIAWLYKLHLSELKWSSTIAIQNIDTTAWPITVNVCNL